MSETKTTKSFEALVSSLPDKPKEEDTFTIAMGDYFPGSEDVLTYNKMKAHLLFGNTIPTLVERIENQFCKEDEAVILEMAYIIACHQSPEVEKPELLVPAYILLFSKLTEVQKWQIVDEFKEKGGQEFIQRTLQVVAAKKKQFKGSRPMDRARWEVLRLSLKYLKRHPSETQLSLDEFAEIAAYDQLEGNKSVL